MSEYTNKEINEFLINYSRFASKVRFRTSEILLDRLENSAIEQEKSTAMLRIYEDAIASSEDFMMWLAALQDIQREQPTFNNVLDFMERFNLEADIDSIYYDFKDIKSPDELLKKLNLKSIKQISHESSMSINQLNGVFKLLLNVLHAQYKNRTINTRILVKTLNKLKHGMLVTEEANSIQIRVPNYHNKVFLTVDINEAKKLSKTIKSTSAAIATIISLIIFTYTKS